MSVLKLACPDGYVVAPDFAARLDAIVSLGFAAVELDGRMVTGHEEEIIRETSLRGIAVSAVQAAHVTGSSGADPAAREASGRELRAMLDFSARVGGAGVAFIDHQVASSLPGERAAAMDRLSDFAAEVGDYAAGVGSYLLLEPLVSGSGALIATIADGIELCRRINSPGLRLVADTYHMCANGEDIPASLRLGVEHIGHIHLSDCLPGGARPMPGLGAVDFASALRAAREIGYTGFFAIEGGIPKDQDRLGALSDCIEHLRSEWKRANDGA